MRIHKTKKQVELVFTDESQKEGSFFASLSSSHGHGSESIAELLNGERKYLPFECEDGQITIIQKNTIVIVRMNNNEVDHIAKLSTKIFARVTLVSGQIVSGFIYHDLPRNYPRLSDYFNNTEQFFYLETETKDCIVNSAFVMFITPGPS